MPGIGYNNLYFVAAILQVALRNIHLVRSCPGITILLAVDQHTCHITNLAQLDFDESVIRRSRLRFLGWNFHFLFI